MVGLVPETDAHKRSGNPAETGAEATGLYFAMLGATVLTAAPAGGLLALSVASESTALAWIAVPVGVASGVLCLWGLGAVAGSRLQARGPELLQRMRVGPEPRSAAPKDAAAEVSSPARSAWMGVLWTVSMIALFPQGLVPLAFLLLGVDEQTWFLALFLAGAWQYLAAIAFVALGLAAGAWALSIQRDAEAAAKTRDG